MHLIENEDFKSRSKHGGSGSFTRDRKLNLKTLLVFITRGVTSSLQRELDLFQKEIMGSEFNIRAVTKGAFTQARAKLKHEAFIEMNDNVLTTFYDQAPYLTWRGMRLLAADGTTLALPKHETVIQEFGQHGFGPNADSEKTLATVSFLYDPLNLLTLDAQIAPYASSEKELLYKHLEKVKTGDLLLLDRGYPSRALFFLLKAKGIEFCMRMKQDWWLPVQDFNSSGEKQRVVKFKLPKKDKELLEDYPEMIDQEIGCRLVRVDLENGEKEILCTSFAEENQYTEEDFSELYHYRWNEEEAYKLFKARVEVENFSGKTALAVKQDFFAKVFMMSLCSVLAFPIEEKIKKEYKDANSTKHKQKINRTSAFSMLRNISVGLFMKHKIKQAIAAFDNIIYNTKEIIRPNRKNERSKRPKRLYYMNYKPL